MVGRKDTLSETCRVEDDCLICFGCYSVQDCARHGYAVDTQSPRAKYAFIRIQRSINQGLLGSAYVFLDFKMEH